MSNKENYLIIGSRPYYNIKLNNIIDIFKKNIRMNMLIPTKDNNCGTIIDEQILNTHVYPYTFFLKGKQKLASRENYIKTGMITKKYIEEYDNFDKTKWSKVIKQNHSDIKYFNYFLKRNNFINYYKGPIIRMGYSAIYYAIQNNKYNIYVHGFSLGKIIHKKQFQMNSNNKVSSCHHSASEQKVLLELHNKNIVDATMCLLEDESLPTFNCQYIKPKLNILFIFLKMYGILILKNYYNNEELNIFLDESNRILEEEKNKIQILDKEERIFHVEKYSKYIKESFSNNSLFNLIALKYTNINSNTKKTLLNKLFYKEGKIKNSGDEWYSDDYDKQFKSIMYLSNVNINNGNFQFITNSSKKHIKYPKQRTENYNTTFKDETIKEVLEKNSNCKLHNIIGEKGTIIIVDTTYIHRNNIINEGSRLTLTQYFI